MFGVLVTVRRVGLGGTVSTLLDCLIRDSARIVKMASSSANDTAKEKAKRGRGRPRKQADISSESLEVEVDGASRASKHVGGERKQDLSFVLSLCIPNRLLGEWHRGIALGATYVQQLNAKVSGGAVAIHPGCRRLEENLRRRAGELSHRITSSSGKCRQAVLEEVVAVGVKKSEVVACQPLLEETNSLNIQMADIREEMASRQEEIRHLKEQVAQLMCQRAEGSNTGKRFEDLSLRQQKRKLGHVKSMAEDALWFMQSFGLIPQSMTLQTSSSGTVSISFRPQPSSGSSSNSTPPPPDNTIMGTLYLLERFGVSDEFYHELTQLHESLPRSYRVKDARKRMCSRVELQRLPAPYDGVCRPIRDLLVEVLEREIEKEPQKFDGEDLLVKLSGDGAQFSHTSSFILLSFSFPGRAADVLSGSGNHTFAAVKGHEDYSLLSSAFREVRGEVNALLADPVVHALGRRFKIDVVLGSDYKFLLLSMGLNGPTSTYACLWCTVPSRDRWDMSVDMAVYTTCTEKARSLESLRVHSAHSTKHCSKHLGSIHSPLINIEPDHVVPDELHLLLRIGDVLIRNLILWADHQDHTERDRGQAHSPSYVSRLERLISSCGVSFRVWQCRDGDGRPRPGSYEWTALSGGQKLKVLRHLPAKLAEFPLTPIVPQLWTEFVAIYEMVSSWNPNELEIEDLHIRAKEWVSKFLSLGSVMEGYQRKNVTPYMHILVYHVPYMMKKYGNLKQFSGQGVEKKNDDSKRNYFSSNRHDGPAEILQAEARLEVLRHEHSRVKRGYEKHDHAYWSEGIQQTWNKRSREAGSVHRKY